MRKKLLVLLAISVFTLSATACAGKPGETAANPPVTVQEQTTAAPAPAETTEDTTAAPESAASSAENDTEASGEQADSSASEGTITGTVDENKGFMIIVVSDADSEAYVFPLDDTQRETYKDIKAGDKVTVSYTNGLPTPDNTSTVVKDIKGAK